MLHFNKPMEPQTTPITDLSNVTNTLSPGTNQNSASQVIPVRANSSPSKYFVYTLLAALFFVAVFFGAQYGFFSAEQSTLSESECIDFAISSKNKPKCLSTIAWHTVSTSTNQGRLASLSYISNQNNQAIFKYEIEKPWLDKKWYSLESIDSSLLTESVKLISIYSFGSDYMYLRDGPFLFDTYDMDLLTFKTSRNPQAQERKSVDFLKDGTPVLYETVHTATSSQIMFFTMSPDGFKEKDRFMLPEDIFAAGNKIEAPCLGYGCIDIKNHPFEYVGGSEIIILYSGSARDVEFSCPVNLNLKSELLVDLYKRTGEIVPMLDQGGLKRNCALASPLAVGESAVLDEQLLLSYDGSYESKDNKSLIVKTKMYITGKIPYTFSK